jgi:hypothetical protein
MVRPTVLVLLLIATPSAARAQAPAAPEPQPDAGTGTRPRLPTPEEVIPDDPAADPHAIRREALFDVAVGALAAGNLDVAERAFVDAAAVPGDPTRAAVAASFAERVRRLRERRAQETPINTPRAAATAPGVPVTAGTLSTRPVRRPVGLAATSADRGARAPLVGITTLLGLALYGWTLPTALGISDESARPFVGVYLLTAASSFAVPYFVTRRANITPGQANVAFYGGTRGAWHGVFAGALITGNLSPDRRYRAWTASLLLGSLVELGGGLVLATRAEMSAGQVRTMGALGDFGLLWGLGTGFFFKLHQKETADQQARGMAAAALVGSAAGLTGGYLLARRRDNTWGDGEVMRMAGLVAGLTGLGFVDLFDREVDFDRRAAPAVAVTTSALGVLAGDYLVRRTDFTVSQSMLIDLSAVSGALGAAGLAYLLLPERTENTDPPLVIAAGLGGTAGFALAYWALADKARPAPDPLRARGAQIPRLSVLPMFGGAGGGQGLALAGTF